VVAVHIRLFIQLGLDNPLESHPTVATQPPFRYRSETASKARRIEEFVFYDDIDPNALNTGIVEIDGRLLGDLWTHCRKTDRKVVADVHVHPGGFQQSESDKANPIVAEIGHLAIILPNFAARATQPGGIGVHEYLGSRRWRDRSHDKPSPFHVGWWPAWR
jgi:hypothetical protein